ncbi:NAD(+) diphosphatase [Arsenicicoccus dermatophilus]|uniref:NAD(+) diphosphatase n=1 Tax=Arsenicicoccus dermatophilus TaxID=1076331 RepID=UPI003916D52F
MTDPAQLLPELALARPGLDRQGWRRDVPGLLDQALADPATQVVEVRGELLETTADLSALVRRGIGEVAVRPGGEELLIHLGRQPDGPRLVGVVRPADDEPGPGWHGLRAVGLTLGDADVAVATALVAMAHWHRAHGWCARCGRPTTVVRAGWVRRCAAGHESFPATSPAVIVAVTDEDDRILLARNASWAPGRMSVLAGFVEPGESLEGAVAREVDEEVGLRVRGVTYAGNQPWPFPGSLMVGFRARAAAGELTFRDGEIGEARWFTREELRAQVRAGTVLSGGSPLSIAYHLIESWFGESLADLHP